MDDGYLDCEVKNGSYGIPVLRSSSVFSPSSFQLPAGLAMPGKVVLLRPYGGEEGTAYGEGDGRVTGAKLEGKVRWVNHPHRRSDGTFLPDAHGVILTSDRAEILFALQGRTAFEKGRGKQLLSATFEAEDERYRWLNTFFCVC